MSLAKSCNRVPRAACLPVPFPNTGEQVASGTPARVFRKLFLDFHEEEEIGSINLRGHLCPEHNTGGINGTDGKPNNLTGERQHRGIL